MVINCERRLVHPGVNLKILGQQSKKISHGSFGPLPEAAFRLNNHNNVIPSKILCAKKIKIPDFRHEFEKTYLPCKLVTFHKAIIISFIKTDRLKRSIQF